MASKLFSIERNLTKAIFFSLDCWRMWTRSTSPNSEKIFLSVFYLQIYLLIEDTCRVWEGGFMVIDLWGVNLSKYIFTYHKWSHSKHNDRIPLHMASMNLNFKGIPLNSLHFYPVLGYWGMCWQLLRTT